MTTPTNEEVRRQFEADAVKLFHNAYREARMGSPRRAGATYAAVQAVVDFTLSSPAVLALVEAAKACRETELGDMACVGSMAPCEDALGRLFAALAACTPAKSEGR